MDEEEFLEQVGDAIEDCMNIDHVEVTPTHLDVVMGDGTVFRLRARVRGSEKEVEDEEDAEAEEE